MMLKRSLTASVISLSLISFTTAGAKAQEQGYTPEIINNFIDSCTAGRGRIVEMICTCYISKIQQEYTFSEFQQVNREIAAGRRPPATLIQIQQSCQVNPNS